MNKKLLAGMAAAAILAGGAGTAAFAATGAPAAASTVAAAASTSQVPAYGPLGSLVAKGTITQSQATAIRNALASYLRSHWQDMRKDCTGPGEDRTPWMLEKGGALETVLGQLVTGHTITKSQASAVTSAFTQWVNSHQGAGQQHGYGHRGEDGDMMGGPGHGMM